VATPDVRDNRVIRGLSEMIRIRDWTRDNTITRGRSLKWAFAESGMATLRRAMLGRDRNQAETGPDNVRDVMTA
jgi:hypothetical protein